MDIFSLVFTEKFSSKPKVLESRPQQLQMTEAVYNAVFNSRNLLVEAGTGVGKSLAYIPRCTEINNLEEIEQFFLGSEENREVDLAGKL